MRKYIDRLLYRHWMRKHNRQPFTAKNYYDVKFPERVDIGLTNACNEKCIMCPNPSLPKPRNFMKPELFEKIVDELHAHGNRSIGIGLFGEPTLHKELISFLKYANAKDIYFNMSSNAIALDKKLSDYLVASGQGRLHLSLYASDAETFKKIHGVDTFEKVVKNIQYFLNRINTAKKTDLKVFINYLEMEENKEGYQAWLDMWMPLIRNIDHIQQYKKPYVTWAGRIKPLSAPIKSMLAFKKPCSFIYDRIAIEADGKVTACCYSWNDSSLHLGDLAHSTIQEIWAGKTLKKLKRNFLKADLSSLKPCRQCHETDCHLWNDPV
jgi:radical SAM protein with 4Fe4S-binding SPASM domain